MLILIRTTSTVKLKFCLTGSVKIIQHWQRYTFWQYWYLLVFVKLQISIPYSTYRTHGCFGSGSSLGTQTFQLFTELLRMRRYASTIRVVGEWACARPGPAGRPSHHRTCPTSPGCIQLRQVPVVKLNELRSYRYQVGNGTGIRQVPAPQLST